MKLYSEGSKCILVEIPNKWHQFVHEHKNDLEDNHGFECRFFCQVLTRLPNLSPTQLQYQYPFKDTLGKNRRVDFAIIDGSKKIAIEVDGFDKTGFGSTKETFDDFLKRQNALVLQGWQVLRFANVYFVRNSDECIKLLNAHINYLHSNTEKSRAEFESKIKEIEKSTYTKIEQLQNEVKRLSSQPNSVSSSQSINDTLDELTQQLQANKEQNEQLQYLLQQKTAKLELQEKKVDNMGKILLAVAAIVIAAMYFVTNGGNKETIAVQPVVQPVLAPQQPKQEQLAPQKQMAVEKPAPVKQDFNIKTSEAIGFVGQNKTVCGNVVQVNYLQTKNGQPTYINFEQSYPNQPFQAVVWGSDRDSVISGVGSSLESFEGKKLCVKGKIAEYKGSAQIVIKELSQLK